ncbi:hypothetical protein K4F52_004881 [Lecanicillium sp. MT-2017a]|nr:hypothetical protein K4F52_004881 [Lecanicillium sp. MT-2017a]
MKFILALALAAFVSAAPQPLPEDAEAQGFFYLYCANDDDYYRCTNEYNARCTSGGHLNSNNNGFCRSRCSCEQDTGCGPIC